MRSILHLNKLIVFSCIIFFTLLSSCHRNISKFEKARPEIVIIIGGDVASHKLTMRDTSGNSADTFKVHRGKKIKWLLVNRDTVKEIKNIYKKPTSQSEDVFSAGPNSIGGSFNWEGTIDREAGGKTEEYNIDWIDKSGNPHTFDPLIQVRPR